MKPERAIGRLLASSIERRVYGLRDSAPPSEVKVFRARPDGTPGKLLRIENGKERGR